MQTENVDNVGDANAPEGDFTDDILKGVKEIADFLGPKFTERSVYHLAEKGAIPVKRLPGVNTIYSRKSALRALFDLAA
jgi:hypothetical protein